MPLKKIPANQHQHLTCRNGTISIKISNLRLQEDEILLVENNHQAYRAHY